MHALYRLAGAGSWPARSGSPSASSSSRPRPRSRTRHFESESPSADSVVADSPGTVQLTFDENVEVSFGSIAVFDAEGPSGRHRRAAPLRGQRPLDRSDRAPPGQRFLRADVASDLRRLAPGARRVHVQRRQVVGERRTVRRPSSRRKAAATRPSASLRDRPRRACSAGIALLIGGVVFAAAVRPRGRRRSRADSLVLIGWVTVFVATIATLLLQGPYAGGFGSLGGLPHRGRARGAAHPLRAPDRDPAPVAARRAAAALRSAPELQSRALVVGARGSARCRDRCDPGPRRPRGHRHLHPVRGAARHAARRRDGHLARRFGRAHTHRHRPRP